MTRSREPNLWSRVLVVGAGEPEAGRAAAEAGCVVVLVGTDAAELGALARELEAAGGRVAVVAGSLVDPAVRRALAELLDELFGPAP